MRAFAAFVRRQAARLTAIGVAGALFALSLPPELADDERRELAARFAFTRLPLAEPAAAPRQRRRPVNPSFERHAAWISALGAAVALADLDGDGLANDVCHVDPRTDLVTVSPAPGTGARFALFALDPAPLPYDRATMAPMGCIPRDLDEDGAADLFVYYWGRPPILFLRRPGAAGAPRPAHYAAQELVATPERWYTNAATFADVDGDGHLDLLVGNYFPDGARVLDAAADTPDTMHDSMSRAGNGGHNRLLLFDGRAGRVAYREVAGVFDRANERAWTLAIGAADLDGDLLPELYFANDFAPDRLLHNRSTPGTPRLVGVRGRKDFTTPSSKALGRDSFKGMSVDFADVNQDGRLDLFVSNISAEYALFESHFLFVSTGAPERMRAGVAPYRDESEPLGVARSDWSWDTRFGDFDNDGTVEALQATGFLKGATDRWPELHELATGNDELLRRASSWPRFEVGDDLSGHAPNPFYVRARSGRYYDLAADLGIDEPQVSRGIATADVDGDGDLDFAVANQWEPSALYRNDAGADAGAFLGLHLLLPPAPDARAGGGPRHRAGHPGPDTPGRPAVGAEVTVSVPGRPALVAQVDGGNGHSGVRSPELHFGLGDAAPNARVPVSVRWRDARGRVQHERFALLPGWHTIVLRARVVANAGAGEREAS